MWMPHLEFGSTFAGLCFGGSGGQHFSLSLLLRGPRRTTEEREMQAHTENRKPEFKTSFCDRYEELLVKCQVALERWTQRREEAWQLGLRGRALGGELVRLQADFAKSYSVLQKHVKECALCEFVGKLTNENAETAEETLTH
jgi:hypothetical protein